jgi:hypothetical protein
MDGDLRIREKVWNNLKFFKTLLEKLIASLKKTTNNGVINQNISTSSSQKQLKIPAF